MAADLRREIGEGRYGSGGRLPSEGELAERYSGGTGSSRTLSKMRQSPGNSRTSSWSSGRRVISVKVR
ncbi:hypothetical protein [Streptomyces hokutonensis]|uniref:HTH gntR-type domain-containing protein n=1 Tax=Streptomyces hokutonensis TaxID=1306990 RepID=A0ABW6MGR7_9ACTN